MQSDGTTGMKRKLPGILRRLVVLAFADLGALLLVILAHGSLSDGWLVPVAGVLAALLLMLAVASVVVGVVHGWYAYPSHRRAILFVVGITLVTFMAHAYFLGVPPAYVQGTASGAVGSTFQDSYVTVASSSAGGILTANVTASGDHPVANLTLTLGSAVLGPSGFANPPTLASPLQPACSSPDCSFYRPAQSVTGRWTVPSSGANLSLTVSYLNISCYTKGSEVYGCVMDEVFYVPEGMGILAGQHCSTGAGAPTDCHLEHPPLVPALLAAGMAVLGEYNSAGWRLMPALLGTLSIPLVFGIAWKVSGEKKIAYLSATLLALDVMFFTQSSIAVLDIPGVFFSLAAFFAYFVDLKVWKFDKNVVAGVLLGVSALAKETALFAVFALATFILFFGEGTGRNRLYSIIKVGLAVGLVFAGGLQIYDWTLGTSQYSTFLKNIEYIVSYGSGLNGGCPWACGWTNSALGGYITPFNWLTYYSPVGYFITTVTVNPGNIHYIDVGYYGVTNFLETWTVFIWAPLIAYVLYRHRKGRQPSLEEFGFEGEAQSPPSAPLETRFAGLTLILFIWGYLPYIFLFFAARVTYPFYIIPAIPAMAMGTSYWLTRTWFPRWLMWLYLAMVFGFFLIYFPDKGFLPVWLRAIIGH